MSNMSKALRFKRYELTDSAEVTFKVQGTSGQVYDLKLVNVSLGGVAAEATDSFLTNEMMEVGAILPSSKLVLKDGELALGRLAVRSIPVDTAKSKVIGFSLIDSKLPLQGKLSHYVKLDLSKNADPTVMELDPEKFNLASFAESDETSVDIFAKTKIFTNFHREWQHTPKYGYYRVRASGKGSRVNLASKRPNGRSDYLVLGSNDYFGFASNPEIEAAAQKAIVDYGFGSTGAAISTGMTKLHTELQEELRSLFKKEACLLYNSGYGANVGIIDGLVGPSDLMVADMIAHASIQDAMRMARGTSRFFKHNDTSHLMNILKNERAQASGCLVITEGVFSMDGDIPPLRKILDICRHDNARLMVDEAHSFGVLGEHGLGACEEAGILEEVDIIMGTFSKICGGIGGFVCADQSVIDWLKYYSRPLMFSVSIPPSTAAAALAALRLFRKDKSYIERAKANIKHFVDGLIGMGIKISPEHRSTVIPVVIGDEKILGKVHQDLNDAGIFVLPVVYPVVSRKECRFRFTVTSELSISDLDYVLNILKQSLDKHGFVPKEGKRIA